MKIIRKMINFFVFVCCFASVNAWFGLRSKEPALKIKFGLGVDPGVSFNIDIPVDLPELEAGGWVEYPRAPGAHLPSLRLYCLPDDVTVCPMYDDTGYIAGLQIAIPASDLTDTVSELSTLGFTKWTTQTKESMEPKEFWINTQYFVSPETLQKATPIRVKEHKKGVLYDGGVWINHVDGTLLKLSANGTQLRKSVFTEQGCLPGMGHHYFYNLTSKSDCNLYPWFALVSQEDLVATGLIYIGRLPPVASGKRDWFERPPPLAAHVIAPRGPPCIYKYAESPGIMSVHVYYVKYPWDIGCILE